VRVDSDNSLIFFGISSKQPRTADKERSSSFKLGEGLPTPHHKKRPC